MTMAQEIELETLKMALAFNRAALALVPAGADKKTEAQVARDRARLAELKMMVTT